MNQHQPPPPPDSANTVDAVNTGNYTYPGMVCSLGGLILLCVLWESWLAPLRPGSYLLSLKALPLLLPFMGAIKRDVYTLQWSSMLIWLYFIEGVVRGFRNPDPATTWLALCEVALVVAFFIFAMLFLRPIKKHAKQHAKQRAKQMESDRRD